MLNGHMFNSIVDLQQVIEPTSELVTVSWTGVCLCECAVLGGGPVDYK